MAGDLVIVRFIQPCDCYNGGERAGFSRQRAAFLVDRKLAVYANEADAPTVTATKTAAPHGKPGPKGKGKAKAEPVQEPAAKPAAPSQVVDPSVPIMNAGEGPGSPA